MTVDSSPSALRVVAAQIAIGVAALAMLAFAPPARGAMLLVPLVSDAPAARLARDGHALLLGQGPAGSLVIRGDRQTLFWPLLQAGVLAIAAPALLCGEAL